MLRWPGRRWKDVRQFHLENNKCTMLCFKSCLAICLLAHNPSLHTIRNSSTWQLLPSSFLIPPISSRIPHDSSSVPRLVTVELLLTCPSSSKAVVPDFVRLHKASIPMLLRHLQRLCCLYKLFNQPLAVET